MNHQSIACQVDTCIYFKQEKCMAKSILVSKDCACVNECCETNCKTFEKK